MNAIGVGEAGVQLAQMTGPSLRSGAFELAASKQNISAERRGERVPAFFLEHFLGRHGNRVDRPLRLARGALVEVIEHEAGLVVFETGSESDGRVVELKFRVLNDRVGNRPEVDEFAVRIVGVDVDPLESEPAWFLGNGWILDRDLETAVPIDVRFEFDRLEFGVSRESASKELERRGGGGGGRGRIVRVERK